MNDISDMDYRKLSVPWRDKLLFVFTGILNKKHLITKEKEDNHEMKREYKTFVPLKEEKTIINKKIPDDINTKEKEKEDVIPFFELDTSKTKSNL